MLHHHDLLDKSHEPAVALACSIHYIHSTPCVEKRVTVFQARLPSIALLTEFANLQEIVKMEEFGIR